MCRRQRGRGGDQVDLRRHRAHLPELWIAHPDRRGKPRVARRCRQGSPHRAVEAVRAGQQRAGRRNAVRRLRRRQEGGLAGAPRGGRAGGRDPNGGNGLHPEEPVERSRSSLTDWARSANTAAKSPATEPGGTEPAARSARADWPGGLLHCGIERGLQGLAVLPLQVVDQAAHLRRRHVGLVGDDGALRGKRPVRVGVVTLRLPRHLGEPAHEERQHDHRCNEQDDRAGR